MSPTPSAPTRDRLRIAIQKKGRLADPARTLLTACGLSWRESRDKLFCVGESLPVDLLLVRDDDIPGLIADGVCDLGIVGFNELDEQAKARRQIGLADAYQPLRALPFGECRLMLGIPEELFTPIFAIARIVGWSAHRLEELINMDKIIRPAYKSVLPRREYVSMKDR